MGTAELIATLDQGVREGRIAPYLADFIAAQELKCTADEVGYTEWGIRASINATADSASLRSDRAE